jgi:uncharacterized membrane protein YdcZ (DUF606 family)
MGYGIMAAAWNTSIGYAVLFVMTFIESNRRYPIPYEYRRLAVLGVLAGAVYVLGSLIRLPSHFLDALARLAVIALYPIALFVLRFFNAREIAGMRLLLARLRPAPRREP